MKRRAAFEADPKRPLSMRDWMVGRTYGRRTVLPVDLVWNLQRLES